MDEHTQGEELGLATEGTILSEEDVKEMQKPAEIDFPMPGEVPTKEEEAQHSHRMPENAEFIDEEGKKS